MATRKPKAAPEILNEQGPLDLITAPAPSAVAVVDLSAIKPEEYVAEIYKPFNVKFAALKVEADTIFFTAAEVAALPEELRATAKLIDITTKGGMDTAIKYRAAFRDDVRLASEKTKDARKAPILTIGRLLDSGLTKIKDAVYPYELKFQTAIKDEEKRKAEEKAEAERVEAERLAAIAANLDAIRALPVTHAAATSAELVKVLSELAAREITVADFAEKIDVAEALVDTIAAELMALHDVACDREKAEAERVAAVERETKRLAEVAEANRKETERLENLRIEHEKTEAETKRRAAAEEQRLADERAAFEKEKAEFAAAKAAAEAPPPAVEPALVAAEVAAEPADTATGDMFEFLPEVAPAPEPAPEPRRMGSVSYGNGYIPSTADPAPAPEPVAPMVPTDIAIAAFGESHGLTPDEWADRLDMFVLAYRNGFLEAA
jgi:hypothetical protein